MSSLSVTVSTYRCPISKRLPADPVLGPDGKTYERAALVQKAIDNNYLVNNYLVDVSNLLPNAEHLAAIESFLEAAGNSKLTEDWKKRRKTVLSKEERAKKSKTRKPKPSGASASQVATQNVLRSVQGWYDKGQYEEALEDHVKFIRTPTPSSDKLLGQIYRALNTEGQHTDLAYFYLRRAAPFPQLNTHYDIAELFRDQGKHGAALRINYAAVGIRGQHGKLLHIRKIAEAHFLGKGTPQDKDEAAKWYQKLASHRYSDGEANAVLSAHYVQQDDIVRAIRHIAIGSKRGRSECIAKMPKIQNFLKTLWEDTTSKDGLDHDGAPPHLRVEVDGRLVHEI